MSDATGDRIIIKEKPPTRYSLAVGLLAFLPALLFGFLTANPFFIFNPIAFALSFTICMTFALVLNRGFSIEISSNGIRQLYLGQPLYTIGWEEVERVVYIESFPGPRYKIKARRSILAAIELPIEDENFLKIKKELAARGLVLAQAQLSSGKG